MWGQDGKLPFDQNMRYRLETEFGSNPKKISIFIRDFRSTVEFVEPSKSDVLTESDGILPFEGGKSGFNQQGGLNAALPTRIRREGSTQEQRTLQQPMDLTIPLIGGGSAVLRTPVPLTKNNFDLIQTFLETLEDSIVAETTDMTGMRLNNLNDRCINRSTQGGGGEDAQLHRLFSR